MGLFKSDLYRSFAIGFALGALALVATMDNPPQVAPSAFAASVQ
ncbi:MAG: hypothetical protein ACREBO_13500 [Novosphingobium sp.]